MDEFSDQLSGGSAKVERCVHMHVAEGWQFEILPWVVGVSGLLAKASARNVLDFLLVPRKSWDNVVEGACIASVKAFYFLHQRSSSVIQSARLAESEGTFCASWKRPGSTKLFTTVTR